jgi:hypothetical protein
LARGCKFADRCLDAWEKCFGDVPPPSYETGLGHFVRCYKYGR